MSSNSNLAFLTCSILSANTDPKVCVDLVFWKELNYCFFVLFPQESLFRDAGHSLHSSVLLVGMKWPLQIFKDLSTLDNNFAFEAVFEKCLQTVHVLVFETE